MSFRIETQALDLGRDAPARFDSILFTETRRFAFTRGGGTLRTEVATIGGQGLRISRVTSTGHVIDLSESDMVSFLAPRHGRLDVRVARRDYRAEAGRMLAFRPNARRTRATAPAAGRFEGHVVMIPERRLALLQGADGQPGPAGQDAAGIAEAAGSRLSAYVAFLFDEIVARSGAAAGVAATQRMAALLEDLLVEAAAAASWREAAVPVRTAALRRVRMAEDLMRAQSDEPLAIHAVAAELGVGLRSLQLAFHAVRGETPRAVLSRMRLERARERLMAGGPGQSVTSIALDCGFTHLGRFAEAYRRAFGERPSDTLARRR